MANLMLMAFVCSAGVSLALAYGEWSYDQNAANGPGSWGGYCGGSQQSPININTTAASYDSSLGTFTLGNYNTVPFNFTAKNSGHTLEVSFPAFVYNVSGGGLPGTYTTAQFHFHWGSIDTQGSEHAVDDKFYAAELHFVSFKTEYQKLALAKTHSDGLAVLGVFLEVTNSTPTNRYFEPILNAASLLRDKGSALKNITFALADLLPSDKSKFYRYQGSLTTPDCNEVVIWTLFKDPVQISQAQLNILRSLKMNNTMALVDNFRPVMELGNRSVKASFNDVYTPTTTTTITTTRTVTTTAITIATTAAAGIALEESYVMLLMMLFGALVLC